MITLKRVTKKKHMQQAFNPYSKTLNRLDYSDFVNKFNDWTIYLVFDDNDFVGINMVNRRNEMGHFYFEQFQGKGIAVRAFKILMENEKRPYYWAITENHYTHAQSALRKLGFKESGVVMSLDGSP